MDASVKPEARDLACGFVRMPLDEFLVRSYLLQLRGSHSASDEEAHGYAGTLALMLGRSSKNAGWPQRTGGRGCLQIPCKCRFGRGCGIAGGRRCWLQIPLQKQPMADRADPPLRRPRASL